MQPLAVQQVDSPLQCDGINNYPSEAIDSGFCTARTFKNALNVRASESILRLTS